MDEAICAFVNPVFVGTNGRTQLGLLLPGIFSYL